MNTSELPLDKAIHMSGLTNPISFFDCIGIDGRVSHYVMSPLPKRNIIVIGNGDEISVAQHANGYFTVIFSGIVRTAMLCDEYGNGVHPCFISSGYNTIDEAIPIELIEEVEDAVILHAVPLNELVVDEETLRWLKGTIVKEYLSMLYKGGYNDAGTDAVDKKIVELKDYLLSIEK